jgi:hypothetical protein
MDKTLQIVDLFVKYKIKMSPIDTLEKAKKEMDALGITNDEVIAIIGEGILEVTE